MTFIYPLRIYTQSNRALIPAIVTEGFKFPYNCYFNSNDRRGKHGGEVGEKEVHVEGWHHRNRKISQIIIEARVVLTFGLKKFFF